MNYYPHHIGDFNSATRHLTRVERSLYRDLIELYYDTEQALPADDFDRLARRVIAISDEEKRALSFVLDEFFDLNDGFYVHERCEQEIIKYRANNSAKARAGKASALSRKNKRDSKKPAQKEQNSTPVEQTLNGCATNQEPITNNQEPIKKNIKKSKPDSWKDFFSAYPENKKGGTDSAAWKAAKREGLTDQDFELMAEDVKNRTRLMPNWYSTYALGITRYISERIWLTPITPEITHGQNQSASGQRKLSAVEQSRAAINANRIARGEAPLGDSEPCRETMGANGGHVRLHVPETVRGYTERHMGEVLDGDYWPTDGGGA